MFKRFVIGLMVSCMTTVAYADETLPTDSLPKANPLAMMRADHIMISTADYQGTVD